MARSWSGNDLQPVWLLLHTGQAPGTQAVSQWPILVRYEAKWASQMSTLYCAMSDLETISTGQAVQAAAFGWFFLLLPSPTLPAFYFLTWHFTHEGNAAVTVH